jgi:hypothetical protein
VSGSQRSRALGQSLMLSRVLRQFSKGLQRGSELRPGFPSEAVFPGASDFSQ